MTRVDELPVDPEGVVVYAEGWQSWSPTRTYRADDPAPHPEAPWELAMRFRDGHRGGPGTWTGEGLLVVDPGTGGPVRRYAIAGDATVDVPTIRAVLRGDRVDVEASGPVEQRDFATTTAALTDFGAAFAGAAGVTALRPAPRVWCSWYQFFEQVRADDVREAVRDLGRLDLPVDVVQLDDGWSRGLGEGLVATNGFDDLAGVVDEVRSSGRRVGIWLAPFLVGRDTTLARDHPDWLVGYAGHNWGQDLAALDLTLPAVREHLHASVGRLVDLGVDYLKLDFVYAAAAPGARHLDVSPVAAYRAGLELVRDAAGADCFLLACGAPVLPSVGLVDAMRVSPDTFHEGGEDGSRGLRGRPGAAGRAWQQGRFWVNDADCLVARPSYALRETWARTIEDFGGLRSCSDRLADLDDWGLRTTRRLLETSPGHEPFPDHVVTAGLAASRVPVASGPLEEGRP